MRLDKNIAECKPVLGISASLVYIDKIFVNNIRRQQLFIFTQCKVDKLMKSFVPQYEYVYVGSGIAYRQSHMKMVNSN